jgi:hypothetical protein
MRWIIRDTNHDACVVDLLFSQTFRENIFPKISRRMHLWSLRARKLDSPTLLQNSREEFYILDGIELLVINWLTDWFLKNTV